MAATKRDVEIALKARDAYSAEFDRLQNRLRGVRSAATQGMRETSGAVEQLARSFRAFGAVEGIFKTTTAAINLFRGDTDAAIETLKRLPFGIGPAVDSLEQFGRSVLGVTEAEERLKKVQAELLIQQKQLADRKKEVASNDASIEQIRRQAQRAFEIEIIPEADPEGTQGFARKFAQIAQEQREALKQLDDLAKQNLNVRQEQELRETRKLIYDLYGIRRRALYFQQQDELDAIRERDEAEKRSIEERLEQVRDSIRQQAFDRREELRLDAEAARRRALAAGSPQGIAPFEARFLNRAPREFFTEANTQEAQRLAELKRVMEQHLEEQKRTNESLASIERNAAVIRVENN